MVSPRQLLVTRSLEALRVRGYNALGVQEIADAAGLPKGSFYNHFASKEDFAVASLEAYAQEGLTATRQILGDNSLTPLAGIVKLYHSRVAFEKKRLATAPGCLINMLAQEMSSTSPAIREAAASAMQQLIDCLGTALGNAVAAREITPPLPVGELAAFCESAWRGALLMARAQNRITPLQNFIKMLPLMLGRRAK